MAKKFEFESGFVLVAKSDGSVWVFSDLLVEFLIIIFLIFQFILSLLKDLERSTWNLEIILCIVAIGRRSHGKHAAIRVRRDRGTPKKLSCDWSMWFMKVILLSSPRSE